MNTHSNVVSDMANARSEVALIATQARTIINLQNRVDALMVSLAIVENDLRLSRRVAEFVGTLNTVVAAKDDQRMGWAAR
jgi:hypothetical protein